MAVQPLGNGNYELVLTLSQRQQSVVNNQSVVRARYSVRKLRGTGYWDTTPRPFNLWVNGAQIINSTTTFDFRSYSELVLWEGDVTVGHNPDGSKTVEAAGFFDGDVIGSGTVNESLRLQDIPRKSTFTVPGSFIMGNPLPVTITRAVARFTHRVSLTSRVGNTTTTIISQSNIGTSTTLQMSTTQIKALCETIPKDLKTTVSVVVETFDGTRSLGSTSVPVVANVPASVVPTVSGIARQWLNGMAGVPGFNGEVYKDFTKITFNPSGAAGVYGSTIVSSTYSVADFSDFRFTKTGSKVVTLTVTDSRGRTASTTTTVDVLEITLPKLEVSWIRCTSNGTPDPFGLYGRPVGKIQGTGDFFLYISIKETGTSIWDASKGPAYSVSSAFDISSGISLYDPATSVNNPGPLTVIRLVGAASDKTYDVWVRLRHRYWQWCDIPMESSVQDILATTKVALDVGVENIGVGKIYTSGRGSIDAKDEIYHRDGKRVLDVDDKAADYVVESGVSGIWTYVKYSGGRCELWATVTPVYLTGNTDFLQTAPQLPFPIVKEISASATKVAAAEGQRWNKSVPGITVSPVNNNITLRLFSAAGLPWQAGDTHRVYVYVMAMWK